MKDSKVKEFLKMWLTIMLGMVMIAGFVCGIVALIFFALSYPWYGIPFGLLIFTLGLAAIESFAPLGGGMDDFQ